MSHPRLAPFKLDVIVVGGAVAGLSMALGLALSGHTVRVLEKSQGLGTNSAGISLPPNVTKILVQWGLADELRKKASLVREGTHLWDYETGDLIGYLEWAEPVIKETGAKFYLMRYSDLHEILYAAALRAGVQVIFDTKVAFAKSPCHSESSDDSSPLPSCDRPSVHLSDGTILETDMIIGADGQHSTVRLSVQGSVVKPRRTGTIVLSGSIPMRRLLEDDALKIPSIAYSWVYWFGPRRCFTGYPMTSDSEYAVHLFWDHEEPEVPEGWIPNLSGKSLKLADTTSDVKLSRIIEKVDSYCWQNYLDWPEIENWSDDSGRIVLIGEASHPLIPCSTQSCSLPVEAAAVLSALLSNVRSLDHIPHLVSAYETIRRERSKFLHEVDATNFKQSMFPPGPERQARDLGMQQLLDARQHKWDDDAYLGLWGHLCKIWAYNAFDAADDWWVEWGMLRERAIRRQDPSLQLPCKVSVSAHIGYL
ncbi:FAD/NAD-P-binding domain-containing protein [Russula emetica]|nr:FAD/NAD-P-binding domain-containing protein [Russula emetica]